MTTLAWIIVLICVAITCYGLGCGAGEEHEQNKPKEPHLIQMGDTWPQMQVQNNLREQIRELTEKYDQMNKYATMQGREIKDLYEGNNKILAQRQALTAENDKLKEELKEYYKLADNSAIQIGKLKERNIILNDAVDKATDTLKAQMVEIDKLRGQIKAGVHYVQDPETGCAIKKDAQEINFEKMDYRLTRIEAILPPIIELPTKTRTAYTADWGKFIESNGFVSHGNAPEPITKPNI